MSCAEPARSRVLLMAEELEEMSDRFGIMRSVDATETARWLEEVAAALREACGPDTGRD